MQCFCEFGAKELQEKSPLNYQIVCCSKCFALKTLVLKKEECVVKFDKIVEMMDEKGHLSGKGDDGKHQFDDFIDNIAKENFELLSGFSRGKNDLIFVVNG